MYDSYIPSHTVMAEDTCKQKANHVISNSSNAASKVHADDTDTIDFHSLTQSPNGKEKQKTKKKKKRLI